MNLLILAVALGSTAPSMSPPQQIETSSPDIPASTPTADKSLPASAGRGPTPKGNPGNWVTTNDYPTSALRTEAQGTSRFKVEVDAEGNVSDCGIIGSSGNAELDDKTCVLLRQRAKFTPPQDAQGRPTTGYYSNAVRWVIPRELQPPVDSRLVRTFDVMRDGSIANCAIVSASGSAATVYQPGPITCPTSMQFAAPRDHAGIRHSRHVIQTVEMKVSDAN